MALFIATNAGENHYVDAKDKDLARKKIRRRLLKKNGRYNITDLKEIKDTRGNRITDGLRHL